MYKHLLVPIDGSPLASVTVEHAVRYAREAGACITFLHVQRDFASTTDGSLLHAIAPAEFDRKASGQSHAWLARASAAAAAAKVDCDTVMTVSERTHEAIQEVAQARGCDLIYMASHGRRGLLGRLAGSVTGRVLETTTIPVLVARVESNAALTAEQRALVAILDDHRSIAAVIRAMQRVAKKDAWKFEESFKLLRAALFYLENFPERQHHPKEEASLFRVLRMRAQESAQVLDQLEQQHREGSSDLQALHGALHAFESGSADARIGFEQALRRFAEAQWAHMELEESIVLPLASAQLTREDWDGIAASFENHASPHADAEAEASFARVFKRLMDLAASITAAG